MSIYLNNIQFIATQWSLLKPTILTFINTISSILKQYFISWVTITFWVKCTRKHIFYTNCFFFFMYSCLDYFVIITKNVISFISLTKNGYFIYYYVIIVTTYIYSYSVLKTFFFIASFIACSLLSFIWKHFLNNFSHSLLYFLAKDTFDDVSCEPFLMLEPPNNEDDYNYCLDSEEGLGDLFGFRL